MAHAAVGRVRWRGVETQSGAAPPRLEAATAAHLALALRPLGAALVPGQPFDAEAVARCSFPSLPSAGPRRAQCQVEVVAGEQHAERRSDVPFRDADDLAESIALLVSGMLQTDFAELPNLPEPEPPAPKLPATPYVESRTQSQSQSQSRTQSQSTTQTQTQTAAQTQSKTQPRAQGQAPTLARPRPDHESLLISLGPSVAVGFSGEPALWGVSLRALYLARRYFRVGGSVVVEGTDVTRDGFQLSFFRLMAAPRVGVGLTQGRVDVDLGAGPALHLLYGRTSDGSHSHTLTSFAVVIGARLGITLAAPLALELGLDVGGSLQDERVAAGPTLVTTFGRWWLDVAVALVYRR